MKIRKTYEANLPNNAVINSYNENQTNAYSCGYINSKFEEYSTTSETNTLISTAITNSHPQATLLYDGSVQTGGVYNLWSNYKFSDYRFFVFQLQATYCTSAFYTYNNILQRWQIFQYEDPANYGTVLLAACQYVSDSSFKCLKAGYGANSAFSDNPYTIRIYGVK